MKKIQIVKDPERPENVVFSEEIEMSSHDGHLSILVPDQAEIRMPVSLARTMVLYILSSVFPAGTSDHIVAAYLRSFVEPGRQTVSQFVKQNFRQEYAG